MWTLPFRLLNAQATTWVLLALNLMVAAAMWHFTRGTILADTWSYLGLAQGILHGEFSQWWAIEGSYPDTFRTPGVPLWIAVGLKLFGSPGAVRVMNLAAYAMALWYTLKLVRHLDPRPLAANIMLLLTLVMVNVPYYIGQLYPEIPVLWALSLAAYIVVLKRDEHWWVAIALGLLYGFVFQCRPVFLFFPFMHVALAWMLGERSVGRMRSFAWMLGAFALSVLPYAMWNQRNHGVFSFTPLEGSGALLHMGVWSGKMPAYTEHFIWHNFTGDEVLRFVPDPEVPGHIERFEAEWRDVKQQVAPLLTAHDSLMMASRGKVSYPALNTFNAAYIMARERELRRLAIAEALRDPWYMVKFKAWSALRLWVIGIQRTDFANADLKGRLSMAYGPLSTGLVFTLFVFLVPMAWRRGLMAWPRLWYLLLLMAYFGLIHIPFTIQARYTTPVRFAMFALLALAVAALWNARRQRVANDG